MLSQQCGDFIVQRRDKIFAYHLATVVDDYEQRITEVFRGSDLLDSTARQVYLQEKLSIQKPQYAHIPTLIDHTGAKLSKQTGAQPVDDSNPAKTLCVLLTLLNQTVPAEITTARTNEIIDWAVKHWDFSKLCSKNHIELPPTKE